jgi:hypothetical protein
MIPYEVASVLATKLFVFTYVSLTYYKNICMLPTI